MGSGLRDVACRAAANEVHLSPALTQARRLEPGRLFAVYSGTSYGPTLSKQVKMRLSGEGLVVILLVGLIAGWLAGRIVAGGGFGLIGDIAVGIVGALIGTWLLSRLGIHLGTGLVRTIIAATIGAVVLLLIIRLVSGGFTGRRWGVPWRRGRF